MHELSTPPQATGIPGGSPKALGGIAGQSAQDLRRRHDLRQQFARQICRRQQFVGIIPAQQIVHAAARGVRIVGRQAAGQPVVDVVLRAEHLVDAAERLRLVVAVPEDLEHRVVRRGKTIAGQAIPVRRIDPLEESAVCSAGRLSDQIGVASRNSRPAASRGTQPKLCPEMAMQRILRRSTAPSASNCRVLPITDCHRLPAAVRASPPAGTACRRGRTRWRSIAVRAVQRCLVAAGSQIISQKRVSHGRDQPPNREWEASYSTKRSSLANGGRQPHRCIVSANTSSVPSADFTEGDVRTPRGKVRACGKPAGSRPPFAS